MSRQSNTRIFISYASKDDQPFVERLYDDLQRLGYDPWMDKRNMPSRGRSLPREVEEQLQACDRVIAVMGTGSIASEACRAERAFAFNAGKVVTALLRLGDYKTLPLEISRYFVPDFRASRPYEAALDELRRVLQDPPVVPGRLFDVPALPPHLQHRPEELGALRESLTAGELRKTTAITSAGHVGIQGMGGVGKTVMAVLAARDYTVRRQFQNGIIWLTFGRQPNVLRQIRKTLAALGDDSTDYQDVELERMQLGQTLEDKECLLILDDVWYAADAEPFVRAINPRCRLLITTRNLEVVGALGARAHPVDVLTVEQSRDLLAQQSELKTDALPPEAPELIQECGRLPLALAMVGAMLRDKPPAFWKHVGNLLRHADLERIKAQFPYYPHTDLLRAMQVSVDALDAKARQRYLALAVLLEDMPIHPAIQQTLWGADQLDALDTAEQFVSLSLARRDGDSGGIRLHDLQLDYVRALNTDPGALESIRWAVRLSSHIIAKDPYQFAAQVVGRLLSHVDAPTIQKFVDEISAWAPKPWLRPLNSALQSPRTALLQTLRGHSDSVHGIAVTSDGKRALSASSDRTLRLWDLNTGRTLATLEGHSAGVQSVAVAPDGKRAVSASWDHTLKVWELETGRALCTLEGHGEGIYCVVVTPDGVHAVSASGDHTLIVWDLEAGRALETLEGHSGPVLGVAVTPDGRRAVSASQDRTLKLWDLETGRVLHTLTGHYADVNGVAVTPNGKWAVSASDDRTVRIWDLLTGELVRTLEDHFSIFWGAKGVAVTPHGERAVVASRDHTVKVWDLETGQVDVLQGHSGEVSGVAIAAGGKTVVSSSLDGTLNVWNLEARRSLPEGHTGPICDIAVAPKAKRAVTASWDSTLKVWDLETGTQLRTLVGHAGNPVLGVGVTLDGKVAISGGWDHTLRLWDVVTGRARLIVTGNWGMVKGVAVTPDGKRAVSACQDKKLRVWNLASWRTRLFGIPLRTLEGHHDEVLGVAVTPDSRRAVSASQDKTLKLWDLETGRALVTLRGHAEAVVSVALAPNAKHAVSASEDKTVRIWDLNTGRTLRTLEGHSDLVKSVAVTPDGKRAISASQDTTVMVWNLDTGVPVATFYCDAPAWACAIVNNECIVAGDRGGRMYILAIEDE